MKNLIFSILFLIFFKLQNSVCVTNSKAKQAFVKEEFCYKHNKCGPQNWPGLCHTGHNQSPVNLDLNECTRVKKLKGKYKEYFLENLYKNPYIPHCYIENNGHSVEMHFKEANSSTTVPILQGNYIGLKERNYRAVQLHFHWGEDENHGSEHTMKGRHFPLELHIVHYSEKYKSFLEAEESDDKEAIAVISILYLLSKHDNLCLNPIISLIPQVKRFENKIEKLGKGLNIKALFPKKLDFYRYFGSLTSPPCSESVVWTVMADNNYISEKQLNTLREVLDHNEENIGRNFRPVQEMRKRELVYYKV